MKTKQIVIVLATFILGLIIGKFIFTGTAKKEVNNHKNETAAEHWTCSMHPQIDMPEPGKCPICGMDLIPKTKNDDSLSVNSFKMTKNAMALANIQTIKIGEATANNSSANGLKLSGKIVENEKQTAVQTAHFGGRIERLYYKSEGEFIKKGSLIASLYSPELVTAQNEFIQALAIKNEQPELYKAVRNKLKNWKISENQINQIERDKKVITNFRMYANVSGYITTVLVEEGSHVKEGKPLFKVSNLSSVWADLDVYEKDIAAIKKGMQVAIKLNAFPDKEFKGKIDFIDPLLNSKTRTTTARATLNNTKKSLKPGMILVATVKTTAQNKTNTASVTIPKSAVMWTGKRSVVYIKTKPDEPVFEMRAVKLGQEVGDAYQVLSGLVLGDEVVTNGTFTVDATAQLLGKRSMMNQEDSQKLKVESEKSEDKKITRLNNVNPKFKQQLNAVFNAYLALKNTLVASNAKKAIQEVGKMEKALNGVKMNLLKQAKGHEIWMPAKKEISTSLNTIKSEKDLEKQRKEFINLSKAMIPLAQAFGTAQTLYVDHCPMANNGQGADWLSENKAITNPFFGEQMLTCGSVEQTIKN